MDMRAGGRFRVKRRNDIERIFREGRRAANRFLTLLAAPNGLDHSRLAVGVSSRHGNAVRRNRIRRLCREAFRLTRAELPACHDYMVIPRPGEEFTIEAIIDSLRVLAPRAAGSRRQETGP